MWPNDGEISNYVNLFLDQWKRAEEALKKTERLRAETMMAAVGELRYAGRRFVDAMDIMRECHEKGTPIGDGATFEKIRCHLIEASENCVKARHDAIDAAVLFIHLRIEKLVESVGSIEVRIHFPKFSLLADEIKAIDKRIIASRKNRKTLEDEYDSIIDGHIDKVVNFYKELAESEQAIRSALSAQQEKEKREGRRNFYIGLMSGVVSSAIVAAVFLAFDGKIKDVFGIKASNAQCEIETKEVGKKP